MTKAELIDFYIAKSKNTIGVEILSLLRNLELLDDPADREPCEYCGAGELQGEYGNLAIYRCLVPQCYGGGKFEQLKPTYCFNCGRKLKEEENERR